MSSRHKGSRLNSTGYADILAAVRRLDTAATSASVAGQVNATHRTCQQIMWRMADLGVLRVAAWQPNPCGHGPYVPVFGLACRDCEPDAPYPAGLRRKERKASRWKVKPELVGFCAAFSLVLDGGATKGQMIEAGGGCSHTVAKLLRHCRSIGLLRISGWMQPARGPFLPVYSVGSGADAAKPAARCKLEVWRAYWHRRKARMDPFRTAEDFEAPVMRRVVSASDAPRLKTTGASSVFALGSA